MLELVKRRKKFDGKRSHGVVQWLTIAVYQIVLLVWKRLLILKK